MFGMLFAVIAGLFKMIAFVLRALLSLILLPVKILAFGLLIKIGMLLVIIVAIAGIIYFHPGC
jgi:hypothetical protein